MKSKKTTFALVIGVAVALLLNFFPQNLSMAINASGPGNACSWGFAAIEIHNLEFLNTYQSKYCDCSPTEKFWKDGDHIRCPQPE